MAIAFRLVVALAVLMAAGNSEAFDPNSQPVGSDSGGSAANITEGITGTVTRRSGEPVAGAFVQASAVSSTSGPIPDIAIVTGARGNFSWPLRPGAYRLTLFLDGTKIASTEAAVLRGHVTALKLRVD
ncbi:MAG: carboxypeptidase-like regulatory domain-containing protein [Beijerinckiaceae bacterium]|nr:carboxypeptidase-like regulatory domain-containing protein [Beijerinckiaceae bacterium]MCI0735050.1 carboxypeptidase-like regulatory domain-containing protein [Beijerinckiaceae bacterium]